MSSSHRSPLCTFCKSAGRPKSEYSSHFVKNKPGPYGVVVCPLLLHHQCPSCLLLGHTPKFCSKLVNRGKTKRVASKCSPHSTYEMSAGPSQQKLKLRQRRIDAILYDKRYWFDVLRREEEINKCLFAQTLFRLSDEQLARVRGWVDGEERFQSTSHTLYNEADEQEAMAEADREFEYLSPTPLPRPKLTRGKGVVDEHW